MVKRKKMNMHNRIQRYRVGKRLSEIAIYNGVAYFAGQVAENLKQDISGQTREVLAIIDRLLCEVGSDKSKLLSVQIFLKDIQDTTAMNAVWDEWISKGDGIGNAPPRATVQAELANPDYKIEIVLVAAC